MKKKWNKENGQMHVVLSFFLIQILLIMLIYVLQIFRYTYISYFIENSLVASTLASALIDLEEYGKSNDIIIKDYQQAFQIFSDTLYTNMRFEEQDTIKNLYIKHYIIYNVKDGSVMYYCFDDGGYCNDIGMAILGTIKTPDHELVEHTTIYSCITYEVDGIL